jgi:cobalt transporter subunit CbtB
VILYGVGFAHHDALHHAAHDTRHSAAFPCH